MIPDHTHSGALPPFLPGASPRDAGAMAPYKSTLLEIAHKYATNDKRKQILSGLVAYRDELRAIGLVDAIQWVDGSFVEDCEMLRGRPPKDVDIVTIALRPPSSANPADWASLVASKQDLFSPAKAKAKYLCDAYFVDLNLHPRYIVDLTKYFFGLFSHQRGTALWKGMLEIPLAGDDSDVLSFLATGVI